MVMAPTYLIDIERVESSLREVQRNFDQINKALNMRRESLRDEILLNMVDGYRYVNMLLENEISILKPDGLVHFLELNHIVLCGTEQRKRKNYLTHIQSTSDRFYQQEQFSIRDLRHWAKEHRHLSPWKQAAGLYILQISWPQLFDEGNHRTGALLMSKILVRLGKPPFVLSVENAKGYFDPSSLAKSTHKNLLGKYYKLPKIKKQFAKFIEKQAKEEFLLKV